MNQYRLSAGLATLVASWGAPTKTEKAAGLRLLMTISGLVLLIACANIANLLLARGAARRSETAIRVALGAPRQRLLGQTLTESVLLAILGGAGGLVVAFAGTRTILLVFFRGSRYVPINAVPSLPVLGFAFLLSLMTGVVFGLAPAWIMARSDPAEALRGAGRSTRDRSSLVQRSLVVLQVALSAVLLIGAGLLTQTLRNLENQRFGFEPQDRLVVRVNPAQAGYKTRENLYGLYQQLEQRLPQIPGVISASYSTYSPMRGDNWAFGIHVEGHPPDEQAGASFDCSSITMVRPGWAISGSTSWVAPNPLPPCSSVLSPTAWPRWWPTDSASPTEWCSPRTAAR